MSPINGPDRGDMVGQKVCVDCSIAKSIGDFPTRGGGKIRTRCLPCFRAYANARRRKPGGMQPVNNLTAVWYMVKGEHESWVDVLIQILFEKRFLVIEKVALEEECIDLQVLLKAEDEIANLVHMEMENEKSSHLSPRLNGRAS